MATETYDLAIIGAGSVGVIAADFAVKLGARVALLERDRIGGDLSPCWRETASAVTAHGQAAFQASRC